MRSPDSLTALLIAPDAQLAQTFAAAMLRRRTFEILGDLSAYPTAQGLETKLRQLRPEVVLVDVASDLNAACELIQHATALKPPVFVIAIHRESDPQAILTSLRSGAAEFLYAPFDIAVQEAAVARIRKLIDPSVLTEKTRGKVIAFTSAKPGAGASTLTIQTARSLSKGGRKRVLVIDLNVAGGSIGFYLRLNQNTSVMDLLSAGTRIDHGMWSGAVVSSGGIDVLQAPDLPWTAPIESNRIAHLLDHARTTYEWVLIDLPCAFDRVSLGLVAEADRAFIVSTPELPSLHLTRRVVKLLKQLGFDQSRFGVLVNRMESRSDLSSDELKQLFDCDIDRGLPSEPDTLFRALAEGRLPDPAESSFGKAIEGLATKLTNTFYEPAAEIPVKAGRPVFSQA